MRRTHLTGFALMAGLSLACAHNSDAPPATAAPMADAQVTNDQAMIELREHHRHHHHGGVTQFIAMSLDTLGADEAKRPQVEKIQDDLHVCLRPPHEIEKKLLQVLSDGVAAGTIDTTKVDATVAQLDATASAVHGCSVDALNRLHALLTPSERAALVDKVHAHWTVWRQVNHEAEVGGKEHGGRLAELGTELSLTPEQIDQMSAALHAAHQRQPAKFDPQAVETHVQAFATAFVGDAFDAKTLTANANGSLATHGARRMAAFYEAVTPILTPAQRTTLADHLREHATQQPQVSSN